MNSFCVVNLNSVNRLKRFTLTEDAAEDRAKRFANFNNSCYSGILEMIVS